MEKKIRSAAIALTVAFVFLYVTATSIKTTPSVPRALEVPKFVKPDTTPTYNETDIELVVLPTAVPDVEAAPDGPGFVEGEEYVIEFETSEKMRNEFTARQLLDQYRDWLLITVVANLDGLTPADVNQILFDMPPTRYTYMQEFGRFEFGVTRTVMLPDDTIIAVVPSDATRAERTDYIAEMADYHRKNTNSKPVSAYVFTYTIDAPQDQGLLIYDGSEDLTSYFTEDTGYVEMAIKSADDLEAFLDKTDTLVYVQQTSTGLMFGGRKRQSSDYRGINIGDVAALYTSQATISKEQLAFQTKWNNQESVIIAAANVALKHVPAPLYGLEPDVDTISATAYQDAQQQASVLLDSYPVECGEAADAVAFPVAFTMTMTAWQNELTKAYTWLICEQYLDQTQSGMVNASGFSLDPAYDYDAVEEFYQDHRDLFLELVENLPTQYIGYVTKDDVIRAGKAIESHEINPLLNLVADFSDVYLTLDSPYFIDVYTLTDDVQTLAFQSARYDGQLEGTEVGMVLFYTDLLAKLWAIDFEDRSPDCDVSLFGSSSEDEACFADFDSLPDRRVAKIYEQEMSDLSYTRLWFGTRDDGFQLTDKGILFSHTATRVYAASSNPLRPGQEAAPNALSAAFLGWWNDHYAELADYEQEYQRLNEIMKWSTVFGWLFTDVNAQGHQTWIAPEKERVMPYLSKVKFETDYWFPDWVQEHPELRFDLWDKVEFYPDGHAGIETESLPRLWGIVSGYTGQRWGGGVSLAEPELFMQTSRQFTSFADELVEVPMQRSYLSYADDLGENVIQTLDDVEYRFLTVDDAVGDNIALLDVNVPGGTKLRGLTDELASVTGTSSLLDPAPSAPTFSRTLQQSDHWASIGTTFDDVPIGSLNISETGNGFKVGWAGSDIDLSQQLALKLSSSAESPITVLTNAPEVSTVVDMGNDVLAVRLEGSNQWLRMTPETTPSLDVPAGWQSRAGGFDDFAENWLMAWDEGSTLFKNEDILLLKRGSKLLQFVSDVPVDASTTTVIIDGEAVRLAKTAAGDSYVVVRDLPEALRTNPNRLNLLLGGDEVSAVRSFPTDNPLYEIVMSNDYDGFAKRLIDQPDETLKLFDDMMTDSLSYVDEQMLAHNNGTAQQFLKTLKRFQPDAHELYLREALIEFEYKNPVRAAEALNDMGPVSRISEADINLLDEFALRSGQRSTNEVRTLESTLWNYLDDAGTTHADDMIAFAQNDVVEFDMKFSTKLEGNEVASIGNDVSEIWIMDHPGLDDLPGMETNTINQMISDGEVRVIAVAEDDIANFRPARVTTADDIHYSRTNLGDAQTNPVTNSVTDGLTDQLQNVLTDVLNGGGGDICKDSKSQCEKDPQIVYIVEFLN